MGDTGLLPLLHLLMSIYVWRPAQVLQNWWLSVWAGQTQAAGDHLSAAGLHFYLGAYSAIGLAALLSQAVRGVIMLFGMLNASRVLHADLISNVSAFQAEECDIT